jgi:hypothetical protein
MMLIIKTKENKAVSFQEYWRKLYEEKKKKEPKIIRPTLVVPEKQKEKK